MPYETNWLGKTIKHDEVFYNYGYEDFGSRLRVSKVISKLYGKKSKYFMKRHFNSARFKHLWNRRISNLTKGELHWLGMILSLESDPRVLLIDEYGVHLTDGMEQEFRSQLKRMNRSLGTTIIITSPSESLVRKFSSVVILLDNGHISKRFGQVQIAKVGQLVQKEEEKAVTTEKKEKYKKSKISTEITGSR